jgi:hypothetical protein
MSINFRPWPLALVLLTLQTTSGQDLADFRRQMRSLEDQSPRDTYDKNRRGLREAMDTDDQKTLQKLTTAEPPVFEYKPKEVSVREHEGTNVRLFASTFTALNVAAAELFVSLQSATLTQCLTQCLQNLLDGC